MSDLASFLWLAARVYFPWCLACWMFCLTTAAIDGIRQRR